MEQNELMHYGVMGMKWGIRRAASKSSQNNKLELKALKYDKKAAIQSKNQKMHILRMILVQRIRRLKKQTNI